MENNVPNLDCMDADDLMMFWQANHFKSRKAVVALFGSFPQGGTRVMNDLANYASNKATAMQCRLRGDVSTALMYEGICDKIYDDLPEYARW